MNKKYIRILGIAAVLAVIALLIAFSMNTPGKITDPETYEPRVYASILALLPPVIAIGNKGSIFLFVCWNPDGSIALFQF